MDRGRVGEDRESKEMDGCPLTEVRKRTDVPLHKPPKYRHQCDSWGVVGSHRYVPMCPTLIQCS
jgi:hypothetical protein